MGGFWCLVLGRQVCQATELPNGVGECESFTFCLSRVLKAEVVQVRGGEGEDIRVAGLEESPILRVPA